MHRCRPPYQIDFVQHETISKRTLLHRFVFDALRLHFVQMLQNVLRVDDGDHRINLRETADFVIDQKRLTHWRRVRQTSRFDDDAIEFLSCFFDFFQRIDQVFSHLF